MALRVVSSVTGDMTNGVLLVGLMGVKLNQVHPIKRWFVFNTRLHSPILLYYVDFRFKIKTIKIYINGYSFCFLLYLAGIYSKDCRPCCVRGEGKGITYLVT